MESLATSIKCVNEVKSDGQQETSSHVARSGITIKQKELGQVAGKK
jgi:hypothetical protein